MSLPVELDTVEGAAQLYDWFGYWPDFHDAEIISLHLNRQRSSSLFIHTWDLTKNVDDSGYYVCTKHVVVEFLFESISQLALTGFSNQNVLFGLDIAKTNSGFRLTLHECYGLAGQIEVGKLSIRFAPGKPQ